MLYCLTDCRHMYSSGSIINPSWFALDTSRGFEHQLLKVYLRATVLISEYLIYVPACIILNRKFALLRGVNKWESSIALVAILMQPATLLIDHGHFQYNTVMLGFVLASISSLLAGRLLWGSVFFVAALCFKQMALYYAPAVFAYLLGGCLLPSFNLGRFMAIAIVTLASFGLIYSPLLLGSIYDSYTSPSPSLNLESFPPRLASFLSSLDPSKIYYPPIIQLVQTTHRIFPFARGLFEDKVANIWCALNTVHKLHVYPPSMTQRVSLSATFVSILPACMTISLFPRRELLPFALASCAWGFFLFSFQVHEKSVLLPLLPMTILLGGEGGLGVKMRAWVGWANILGAYTLFPLLKRDGLQLPYFILTLLWSYLLGLPPTSLSLYYTSPVAPNSTTTRPKFNPNTVPLFIKTLHLASYTAIIIWHILEACLPPPVGKPDLYPVLNAVIGAGGFTVCWVWCTWQLILRSGVLMDYFSFRESYEGRLMAMAMEKKVQ